VVGKGVKAIVHGTGYVCPRGGLIFDKDKFDFVLRVKRGKGI
jgi:hypothetical protein